MGNWQKNIRQVRPYVPGEQPSQPNIIKLNTNENPYPPAPGVIEVLKELDTDRFRMYPDPSSTMLINALAEYYQVSADQVFVGVGSDDVLAMAFLTFFNSGKPILFPDITYSFYDVWADLFRIPYECPKLTEDFRICAEDYKKPNGGIVIANPNAPTSMAEDICFIEEIVKANPDSIVIIDEAYVDFGAVSAVSLVEKYENLFVVQTFSKSRSMAGVRIGFAIANPVLIKAINNVKYSYNSYTINQISLALGAAAVREDAYFKQMVQKIIATRERTKEALEPLGFHCFDSRANFLFAAHNKIPAKELFERLRAENIYVRYFAKPRIDNYLRITIGTDAQMEVFLQKVKKMV